MDNLTLDSEKFGQKSLDLVNSEKMLNQWFRNNFFESCDCNFK